MAKLTYQSLSFKDESDCLRVYLYDIFYFDIPKLDLLKIDKYVVSRHEIDFVSVNQSKAEKKFSFLISKYILNLKNSIGDKPSVYVHANSGIPLLGNGSFGIVDRGSNLIEIKPITSCNLDCIYCSVNNKIRATDFIIEPEYLVEELSKIVAIKKSDDVEIHIGCQGEPLLYSPLVDLVKLISSIDKVKKISMDTNATLITKKLADRLIRAGMTQFNISINAINSEKAKYIANAHYDIKQSMEITQYISKKLDIIIAPVIVPNLNEVDMDDLVKFTKKLQKNTKFKVKLAFQKYMYYKFGKKPAKEVSWDVFFKQLDELESKYDIKLRLGPEDFSIVEDNSPEKPFKKGDVVTGKIVCDGRISDEKIIVCENRTVSVADCSKKSGNVKVKILRNKHNIFFGVE